MSGFQGMNTAEVADLASLLSERAQSLSTLLETLTGRVDGVIGAQWIGPDADDFAVTFRSAVHSPFTAAVDALTARGTDLENHVEEQNGASSDAGGTGGAGVGGGTSAGAGAAGGAGADAAGGTAQKGPGTPPATAAAGFLGADWSDISFGEVWDNWKENVGIDGVDGADGILGTAHSFAKNFGDFALGKGSVPAFIPLIGDGFTGVMAGIDRWNDDAGRSDLSTGERIGRAVLDGGANFVGSVAGSFVGGAIGTGIGGAIGGLFGGGGGAAAGAPAAGVGAVPGAAAGGVTGTGVGGVVGGIVGDVVGSYIGATTADSVIDSFLD